MPSWWKESEYSKLYWAAARLAKWMLRNRGGIISGLPGSGKTTKCLLATCEFLSMDRAIVFSVPLRMLRDEILSRFHDKNSVFHHYLGKIVVVRAHDEVCPKLKERMQKGKNYWEALAEHIKNYNEGKEPCFWKNEIKKAMEAILKKKIIITTHGIAIMIFLLTWAMKTKKIMFIFDEGDTIFTEISDPLNAKDIEIIKQIEPKLYKRILKLMEAPTMWKSMNTNFFLHQKIIWQMLTNSYFITATYPPSVIEFFDRYLNKKIDEYRVRVRNPERDVIILLTEELKWREYRKWNQILALQLLEIAEESIKKFGALAIVSRSYNQTEDLEKLFEGAGYTVWSDRRIELCGNPKNYDESDIVILTVLGKGYRGLNFYSKKSRGDFPVIIGFYQVPGPDIVHPIFHFMFSDDPNDEYSEMSLFIKDLVNAKNIQALFRFNRDRHRKHLVILLDKRWWSALHNYVPYYYNEANVIDVGLDDVSKLAVPLIKSM